MAGRSLVLASAGCRTATCVADACDSCWPVARKKLSHRGFRNECVRANHASTGIVKSWAAGDFTKGFLHPMQMGI